VHDYYIKLFFGIRAERRCIILNWIIREPLVWEYLRNVGIDGAKPDIHLRRFFGSDRMAKSKISPASIYDVLCQIEELSKETGFTQTEIDDLIWRFCADGYGEICTKNPICQECVVRYKCSRGKLIEDIK
jgi:hypothetical protein